MATTTTTSQLDGWFKERYGEAVDAVPEFAEVQNSVPFAKRDRIGDSFHFPVSLTRPHGLTITSSVGTAFGLNDAASMVSKDAVVASSEYMMTENIAYSVISRARSSKEAFGDAFDHVVTALRESASFYLEAFLLYGGSSKGIGVVRARYTDSGTTQVFQLTKASWAPGLWAQMQGAEIDIIDTTLATLRNSSDGTYANRTSLVVGAVNVAERTVSLTGTEAQMDAIANTDVIFPRGAYRNGTGHMWSYGIDGIARNTGSLFGIDAAAYPLWQVGSYVAGSGLGAGLTMSKLQAAATAALVRGLKGSCKVRLSPYAWTDLNNDLSALRRYADSTRQEMDAGTQSIKFYGVTNGTMELVPHAMVKAGEAFLGQDETLKRIGSTDITFNLGVPGQEESFFQELPSNAGVQLRTFSDQALIITEPAKWVKISGILNASLPSATTEYDV